MDDIFELSSSAAPVFDNTAALMPACPWLDVLNPEQRLAVETTEGPVLVLSGAGTGKTKVLTTRLAYILAQRKAAPWECLVVTFTNRAAREMRERVEQLIGGAVNSVWLGTFHSICVKILRAHAELVGLRSNFTILDEDDQKRLLKQIIEAESIDAEKYPPQAVLDKICRWKDKGLTADKLSDEYKNNVTLHLYRLYQQRLLELNCVDFGDIILHTLQILMSDQEVLTKYQQRFKYIMVDEYQDTNVSQYLLIRLLTQIHRNLCCVGDDDQSIYSWRGAEIENILRFNKDFADARIIRLERNYRSTANILAAASCLISHNSGRLGKTLKVAEASPALQNDNSKIKIISTYNGEEEASWVAEEISNLCRRGLTYSQMAVLVRTAVQTRAFEEKFIAEAIPYQVIGGLKFYERAEIRDALAYFRVILQPDDNMALERIINKPARGIGAKSLAKFQAEARQRHCSLYQAVRQMLDDGLLSGKIKTALETLWQNFAEWRRILPAITPDELAEQVLEDSGYMEMLRQDQSAEAPGRLENLKELIGVMSDQNNYPSLSEFMEHVSLVMDKDDVTSDNKIMLITLHSAKGLEFDVVFLPGWEEGLFPLQRSLEEGGDTALEEERRLAYVAITRAKQRLYILMAYNRRVYGQWQNNLPSRFINELPPANIELCNCCSGYFGGNTYNYETSSNNFGRDSQPIEETYNNGRSRYSNLHFRDSHRASGSNVIGTRVHHDTFGYGKVIAAEGNVFQVCFDNGAVKKLMGSYLTKI